MSKTILNDGDNSVLDLEERIESVDSESYSLLSDSGINKNQDDLLLNFLTKLTQNGMKIVEVVSYPLSDRDERYKKVQGLSSLKGYAIDQEVKVVSFDSVQKPGYVRINNQLDMPLINNKLNNFPLYFYDKDDAVKFVHQLNVEVYKKIEEAKDHYLRASEYMKSIVENNLY